MYDMENKKKKKLNCKYELIYTQAYIHTIYKYDIL